MTRRAAIVPAVIAVLAAATAWRLLAPVALPPATNTAPVAIANEPGAPPLQATSQAPAVAKPAVPVARPGADQPLSLAYPALLLLARGGDVDAMFDLGSRLRLCENSNGRSARQFLDLRQDELDKLEQQAPPGDAKARFQAAALRDDIDMRTRTIAECEAVPEGERRSIAWIEAAALAGHRQARGIYLVDGLDEFGLGAPDFIANIDEVMRRRDIARRFAREDVDACVPGAFGTRMAAMDRTLGVLEPAQRLEAAQAAMLEARSDDQRDVARTFASEAAAGLDVAAREQARRAGEDAWRRCSGRR